MVDTARQLADLLAAMPVNMSGLISSQDLRDFLVSAMPTGRGAAKVVASAAASDLRKAQADYVCDGVADDVQINAAIAALPAGGGKVVLSEGTFNIAASIALVSNLVLQGQGIGVTVLNLVAAANVSVLSASSKSNLALADLTVDGNKANQTSGTNNAINFTTCTEVNVSRIEVKNSYYEGLNFVTNCFNIWVRDCLLQASTRSGLRVASSWFVTVSGNISRLNTRHGIALDAFCSQATVTGNVCQNNTMNGIHLETTHYGTTVAGNACLDNDENGINLNASEAADIIEHIIVTGNVCFNSGDFGIRVRTSNATATIRDIIVTGNACMENDRDQEGYQGIGLSAIASSTFDSVVVAGNRCGDRQGSPTQNHGLLIEAGATNILVEGNNFLNNVTGGVSDLSTGGATFRNNLGYNPVGVLGPPAVPASTVAYTNAYGVDAQVFITGGTVTVIKIGSFTTGLTSGIFVVPAGQTITITYSSVPTWTWYGL